MRLRSIDYLCAYLHHTTVNRSSYALNDINHMLDPQLHSEHIDTWLNAFSLWREMYPTPVQPQFCSKSRPETENFHKRDSTVKFKVKGERKGEKCQVSSMAAASRLGEIIFESFHDTEVCMKNYEMEVLYQMHDSQIVMGISLTSKRVSIRNRVACGPTTLDAANAYALVKWANIQPGEVVLDPMGGSGTIPIEGSHLHPSAHFISSDHSMGNVEISMSNVKEYAGKGPLSVFCCDISRLALRPQSVDVIISDLPFGMRIGSVSANKSLYPSLFKAMERALRSGGRAILLTMAKAVILKVIKERARLGWTLVHERQLEVGGYRSWVFELSYQFLPNASNANRELVHQMTGQPRTRALEKRTAHADSSTS